MAGPIKTVPTESGRGRLQENQVFDHLEPETIPAVLGILSRIGRDHQLSEQLAVETQNQLSENLRLTENIHLAGSRHELIRIELEFIDKLNQLPAASLELNRPRQTAEAPAAGETDRQNESIRIRALAADLVKLDRCRDLLYDLSRQQVRLPEPVSSPADQDRIQTVLTEIDQRLAGVDQLTRQQLQQNLQQLVGFLTNHRQQPPADSQNQPPDPITRTLEKALAQALAGNGQSRRRVGLSITNLVELNRIALIELDQLCQSLELQPAGQNQNRQLNQPRRLLADSKNQLDNCLNHYQQLIKAHLLLRRDKADCQTRLSTINTQAALEIVTGTDFSNHQDQDLTQPVVELILTTVYEYHQQILALEASNGAASNQSP